MLIEGHGAPPCPYAMLVLGSGGRGESLMAPDQDNAIVFAHGEPEGRKTAGSRRSAKSLPTRSTSPACPIARAESWPGTRRFAASLETLEDPRRGMGQALAAARPAQRRHRLRPEACSRRLGAGRRASSTMPMTRGHAEPVFAKLLGEQITAGNPSRSWWPSARRWPAGHQEAWPVPDHCGGTHSGNSPRHSRLSTRARLEGLIALDIGGDRDMKAMLSGHAYSARVAARPADS